MHPFVSVIMSVHNGAAHLAESVESILAQTFRDFEFVIVDDASTDTTVQILDEYAKKDPRIKVIKNEKNLGLTKSLNKAISTAVGEYIARMDAGDTSERSRFAKQVNFLNTNTEYGLVGAWAYTIDDHSKRVGEMKYATGNEQLKKSLIRNNTIVHSSIMVRRSVLDLSGHYDETWKYAQDYELYFRIAKHTNMANLGEYLVSYRISPQSITSRKNKQQVLFAVKARMKAIREGQYSVWSYVYLWKPMLGYLLPYDLKRAIKKLLHI